MKKIIKKFLSATLCISLLVCISASIASFATFEGPYCCDSCFCCNNTDREYYGCPFDYNSINEDYLEANKEDYIAHCFFDDVKNKFTIYLTNGNAFTATFNYDGNLLIKSVVFSSEYDKSLPRTFFGIPLEYNEWTKFEYSQPYEYDYYPDGFSNIDTSDIIYY
ncbi:MAG: hypothetical protein Q4E61_04160 [Alphaproteobacteria bacterium]|nr:hypothetical protein [Alphaproteobacteria bacterium]